MPLISLLLTLALVGFVLWLVVTYVPMPDPFKKVIVVIMVLALVLWLLQVFGITGPALPRIGR